MSGRGFRALLIDQFAGQLTPEALGKIPIAGQIPIVIAGQIPIWGKC